MANQQHIEWLLEGVEAWNARRRENDFIPDFSNADLVGAFMETRGLGSGRIPLASVNFEGANLEGANLGAANLENASLGKARLGGAILTAAILKFADLRGAKFQRTNVLVLTGSLHVKPTTYSVTNLIEADLSDVLVGSVTITPMGRKAVEITDISNAIGLTQEQINLMNGDSGTILPDGIERPAHWPKLEIPEGGVTFDSNPDPVFTFISYAHQDREKVRAFRDALATHDIPIWWYHDIDPGAPWREEIASNLSKAAAVVTF